MSNEQIDEETLAAFLDGGLTKEERDEVLRVLANSPEAYARFVEAASLAEALREEESAPALAPAEASKAPLPNVIPLRRPVPSSRRIMTFAVPLLAAAGIAAVLLVNRGGGAPRDAVGLAEMVAVAPNAGPGALDRNLGTGWDEPPWSVTRGAAAEPMTAGLAARLGVRYALLEAAAAASDSIAFSRNASALTTSLSNVEGAGPLSSRISAQHLRTPDDRREAGAQLRSLVSDAHAFDLGVWLGAARMLSRSPNGATSVVAANSLRLLQRDVDATSKAPNAEQWGPTLRPLTALLGSAGGGASPMSAAEVRARVDSALAAIPR